MLILWVPKMPSESFRPEFHQINEFNFDSAFVNSDNSASHSLGQTNLRTDGWPSYRRVLPQTRHSVSKGGTLQIERHNLNFRTCLNRLQRRTICFSRSEELHDAVIKLFVHHSRTSQLQF